MARRQEDVDIKSEDDAVEFTDSQLVELDILITDVRRDEELTIETENDWEQATQVVVKEKVVVTPQQEEEVTPHQEEEAIPKQEVQEDDDGLFGRESPSVEMQLIAAASQALHEIHEELEDVFGDLTVSQEEDMVRIVEEDAEKRREDKKEEKEVVDPFAEESPTAEERLVAAASEALKQIQEEFEDAADPFADMTASQEAKMAEIVEADAEKRRGEENKRANEERK